MKYKIMIVLFSILIISCNSNKIIYKDYQIGDYISNEFISEVEKKDTLFFKFLPETLGFHTAFYYKINGIKYTCTINYNKIIEISTDDKNFYTTENVNVGYPVKSILPLLSNIKYIPEYGIFGTIKSGWNVVMDDGSYKSNKINDNFIVLSFFINEKSKMKIDYNLYKKR